MGIYDIVHLEDDGNITRAMQRLCEDENLSYHCLLTLDALNNFLKHSEGDIYFVDGNFPRRNGDAAEYLAEEAIDIIRNRDPKARILLLSNDPLIEKTAQQKNVPYKTDKSGMRKVLKDFKKVKQ